MSAGISRLVEEIMADFGAGLDDGRRNELRIELQLKLNGLANRIDKGYDIQVNAAAEDDEAELEEEDDEEAVEMRRTHAEAIDRILAVSEQIRFFRREGPPLLSLPEGRSGGDNTANQDSPTGERAQEK